MWASVISTNAFTFNVSTRCSHSRLSSRRGSNACEQQNLFFQVFTALLQEVVDRHSDKEVLDACAKTLERLCDDRHAIYSRCDIARSKLLDMVSEQYFLKGKT